MTLITATIKDVTGRPDNSSWIFYSPTFQEGAGGLVVSTQKREVKLQAGMLSVDVDPGACVIQHGDDRWTVTIPEADSSLWDVIEAGVAHPPNTAQELLAAAVDQYVETARAKFRTRAVPVNPEDPNTLYQWTDETGTTVGSPVPLTDIIPTPVATAAAQAVTPDVVDADLASRDITYEDVGGGEGVIKAGGTVIGGPKAWPAATASNVAGLQTRLQGWAGADAYIDFTTKTDGDPPAILDTGQTVDFVQDANGNKPQISSGKLAPGTLPGSGGYACYYQAQLDGDARELGARWTVSSADGSTNATALLVTWAGVYESNLGNTVPKTPAHIAFNTMDGSWQWFVSDGEGAGGDHLQVVKSGTFTSPANDGVTVWEAAALLDPDNGKAWLYLPGVDSVTGSRVVTLTDAEIATALTGVSLPVVTLAELCDGSDVVSVEHFATSNANTARLPRFLDMWGNVTRGPRVRSSALRFEAAVETGVVRDAFLIHNPATLLSTATAVSPATIDSSNVVVYQKAGPTGKVIVEVRGYYEFTADDVIFWRVQTYTPSFASVDPVAVLVGVAGEKKNATQVFAFTGYVPGQELEIHLQHWSTVNGSATLQAGGSGAGPYRPPLTMRATSL